MSGAFVAYTRLPSGEAGVIVTSPIRPEVGMQVRAHRPAAPAPRRRDGTGTVETIAGIESTHRDGPSTRYRCRIVDAGVPRCDTCFVRCEVTCCAACLADDPQRAFEGAS